MSDRLNYSRNVTQTILRTALVLAGAGLVVVGAIFGSLKPGTAVAAAGINQTINFQGRLLTPAGAVVADGNYNMQFKIYQDGDGLSAADATGSPAGSLKWTETWQNSASNGVTVKNGYFSVALGSLTAFGSSVNWNQDTLWLSMNVGGTSTGASPTYDGEMLPMKRLSSAVYALNAGQLGGLTSGQYVQLAQGIQTASVTSQPAIGINATSGSNNLITLQSSGTDVFDVTSTGNLQFGNNADKTISVATASSGSNGNNLTIQAGSGNGTSKNGGNLVLQGGNSTAGGTPGSVIVKPQTDVATAFQVQKSGGNQVLVVDTSGGQLVLGQSSAVNGKITLDNGTNANTATIYNDGNLHVDSGSNNTWIDGSDVYIDANSHGNVGVNTSSPGDILTVNGNVQVRDADAASRAYRVRTSGSGVDLEGGGAQLYLSVWSAASFSGTQYNQLIFDNTGGDINVQRSEFFATGADRSIYVQPAASGNNGNNLTIQAGSGTGTSKNGGNLVLQGGNSTSGGTAGSVIVKPQTDTTTAFQVLNAAGTAQALTVDTSGNHVIVGGTAPCIGLSSYGRLCVGQNVGSVGGGTTITNAMNYTQVPLTSGSPDIIVGQKIRVDDTSSAFANTIQGLSVDTSNSTNTSATINSIQAIAPAANSGNLLDLQSCSGGSCATVADVLKVSNTGAALFQNQTNSAAALQVQTAAGTSVLTADTLNNQVTTNDHIIGSAANSGGAGHLFADGFEAGGVSTWDAAGGTGTKSTQTTTVRSGKYAESLDTTAGSKTAYVQTTLASNSTVYGRTYFNVSNLGNPTPLMDFGSGAMGVGTHLYIYLGASGNLCYNYNAGASTACSSTAPSTSAWHKLETKYVAGSGANGVLQVWLDNTLVTTNTNAINISNGTWTANLTNFAIGSNVSSTAKVFFDDVAVDTTATGDSASLYVADAIHAGGTVAVTTTSPAAFQVQSAAGTAYLTVDTESAHVNIGAGGGCTSPSGKLCVSQSVTAPSGNAADINTNTTTSGAVSGSPNTYSNLAKFSDTSTGSGATDYGYYFDASGSTNASSTINSIMAIAPAANAGNLLDLQSCSGGSCATVADVLKVSNTGATTIAPTANSVVGLTVKGTTGTAAHVLDIYNSNATPTLQDYFDANGSLNVGQLIQPTTNNSVALGTSALNFTSVFARNFTFDGTAAGNLNFGASAASANNLNITGQTATAGTGGLVQIQGGNTVAAGTDGGVTIDAGSGATTPNGTISVGNSNASTINIGNGAVARTVNLATGGGANNQTVNIGTGVTGASNTSAITIGSNNAAADTVTLQAGSTSEALSNSGDTIKTSTNSTTAFQIQNALSTPILNLDDTTVNLVQNPGFEVNGNNWSATGTGASVARTTTAANVYYGAGSLAATLASSGSTSVQTSTFTSTPGAGFYSVSFEAKGSAAITISSISLGAGTCTVNTTSVTTNWTYYWCTSTTSITPTQVQINTSTTGQTLYIDDVQLESVSGSSSKPTPFLPSSFNLQGSVVINGNQTQTTTNRYALTINTPSDSQATGGGGLLIQGTNNDINQNDLQVNSVGFTQFLVNTTANTASFNGGSAFFAAPALTVTTTDAGAQALIVVGASSQSANILEVRNSGSVPLLTIGPSSARIGDNSNNVSYNSSFEPTLNGSAQHTRKITLSAEYPGATMTADGSSNSGTMTSDNMTSSPFRNYYEWKTTQGTAQDYDIWVKIPLPSDFNGLPSGQTICLDTYASASSANLVNMTVYDTGNSAVLTSADLSPLSVTTWANKCTSSITSGTYTAGSDMTLDIKMTAPATTGDVRIGDITFSYTSKW